MLLLPLKKSKRLRNNQGIIALIPLLVIAIVVIVFSLFVKPDFLKTLLPSPTSNASSSIPPSETPTISPTPTVKPTPTIAPTPKPTITGTPKPTTAPVSGPPGAGYSYINVATQKGNFMARVVSIDMNSARMITDTGNDSDCSDNCTVLPLSDYLNRNGGFAAVNGSYFCPDTYPDCQSKKNSYDFPVYNTRLGKWINGGNLFWNGRSMVYADGGGIHYVQDAKSFGGGLTAGITNYPGLLNGGNVQIDDNQSGLSDKQKARGTKVGIGTIGSSRALIVVASSVNMQEFAYVFKALGADGALNLDTGGSTAMWWGGYKIGPGRNLPNAIIFSSK